MEIEEEKKEGMGMDSRLLDKRQPVSRVDDAEEGLQTAMRTNERQSVSMHLHQNRNAKNVMGKESRITRRDFGKHRLVSRIAAPREAPDHIGYGYSPIAMPRWERKQMKGSHGTNAGGNASSHNA
jgi:hypothetical protein